MYLLYQKKPAGETTSFAKKFVIKDFKYNSQQPEDIAKQIFDELNAYFTNEKLMFIGGI
jgi:hypothetical protein